MKKGCAVEFVTRDMKGAGRVLSVAHGAVEVKPTSLLIYTGWGWIHSHNKEPILMWERHCRVVETV